MHRFLLTLACVCSGLAAQAFEPLWLRDAVISPDGQRIAFCYKGDIYTVSSAGGTASQITTHPAYDERPVWSPDGRQLAFSSDRNGNFDIYVMPSEGGPARRLTTHSAAEEPTAFSPDGSYVLFNATIQDPAESALFPKASLTELYRVPVAGGRTEQVLGTPAEAVCFAPDGQSFYYHDRKGSENQWRKHHTSSVTRDIWHYDAATGRHINLTHRAGEDRQPVLSPDGTMLYFLSERDGGSFNVYRAPVTNMQAAEAVTHFAPHPVRFLSVATNGLLCYAYDGALYTQTPGGEPVRVRISLTSDDAPQIKHLSTSSGATDATVSPDGEQIAFVVRGEVFVTSVEYNTTKQITHTAAAESSPSFGSDNRTLVYSSYRDGMHQLYMAKIARTDDRNFANATLISEEHLLPSTTVERGFPRFSPDGKEIAFIEDRCKLMVLNLATRQVRQITDGSTWYRRTGGFDYEWSPDGQWFTLEYVANGHDPYTDIGLVSARGGSPIINLTNSGYSSEQPRFALDGNAVLFTTERYGMRAHASWGSQDDAMLVFLNQDAYDKYCLSEEDYNLRKELEAEHKKAQKKDGDAKNDKNKKKKDKTTDDDEADEVKKVVVELKGLEDRVVRLTPNSSNMGGVIISKDGKSLYYLAAFEQGRDLWKLDLREGETRLLRKLDTGSAWLESDREGKYIFLLNGKNMQKLTVASDKLESISYRAEFEIDLSAEREAMFNYVYREEKERFYDPNMHGVDWDSLTACYRKFLPHINNNYDFSEMLSEWLGELNVSHTGSSYRAGSDNSKPTASLGVLFDWNYTDRGVRIAEVLTDGPLDNALSKVKAGMVIEQIDGTDITPETDVYSLLAGKARRKTLLSIYDPAQGKRWQEVVMPITTAQFNTLLYRRWVKQRAAQVKEWSGGQLGYVHIESMDDESFRSVYSDLLGKFNHCKGVVIDTRFNGGGRLHEDIEVLFSGEKYFTQVVRGREACDMPSRRWNKPSIMLMCEANYSNAHGTPWVYSHRRLGKLVGMPVAGTMTSVNWVTLQDRSLYFGIPVVGYRIADGSYLENQQLYPDIEVVNDPATVVKGEDLQLKRAVEELMKEIE